MIKKTRCEKGREKKRKFRQVDKKKSDYFKGKNLTCYLFYISEISAFELIYNRLECRKKQDLTIDKKGNGIVKI